MAQQQFQRNPSIKMNALSEFKLRLVAPPTQGATKKATLSMGVYKNNPRLVVRTNVPNDKDFGRITAAMDTFTFFTMLHAIRMHADGPADSKTKIENRSTFVAGRKMDSPVCVSTTFVGKDKDGVVFIAITARDRPNIKFDFLCDEIWHAFSHGDGRPYTAAEASVLYAKGWCTTAEVLVPQILVSEYVEPDMSNAGGGNNNQNNQSGGNRQASSGTAPSSASSSGDDDLPFN
jgi:hypothetical protein